MEGGHGSERRGLGRLPVLVPAQPRASPAPASQPYSQPREPSPGSHS